MLQLERDSKTWRFIEKWADEELAKLRLALEQPGIAERDADTVRGAISNLKALKGLASQDRKPLTEQENS